VYLVHSRSRDSALLRMALGMLKEIVQEDLFGRPQRWLY